MTKQAEATNPNAGGPDRITAYAEMLPMALLNIRVYGDKWADYDSHLRHTIRAARSHLTPDNPIFSKGRTEALGNLELLVAALASPEDASAELASRFPLVMMAIRALTPEDRELLQVEYQAVFCVHRSANDSG